VKKLRLAELKRPRNKNSRAFLVFTASNLSKITFYGFFAHPPKNTVEFFKLAEY